MNNKGFTLIEAVVALAIFIAISSILAQIVVVSIQNQIKVGIAQNTFVQAVFALDKIEKELRMAKKDMDGTCLEDYEKNYKVNTEKNSITFLYNDQISKEYVCKEFALENEVIKERLAGGETFDVTSSSITIDELQFEVFNDGNSNEQPRVVITMTVSSKDLEGDPPIKLQTTISQRRLNF